MQPTNNSNKKKWSEKSWKSVFFSVPSIPTWKSLSLQIKPAKGRGARRWPLEKECKPPSPEGSPVGPLHGWRNIPSHKHTTSVPGISTESLPLRNKNLPLHQIYQRKMVKSSFWQRHVSVGGNRLAGRDWRAFNSKKPTGNGSKQIVRRQLILCLWLALKRLCFAIGKWQERILKRETSIQKTYPWFAWN